ncbi:NPCBM/NEW2 domain-containing protein [Streptomyces sp. 8N616]
MTDASVVRLVITDAGDGIDSDHADWADWADAELTCR